MPKARRILIAGVLAVGGVLYAAGAGAVGVQAAVPNQTGYAVTATAAPPREAAYRLPGLLRGDSPVYPPIMLTPRTLVAVETTTGASGTARQAGLAAWSLTGKLLWSYRPTAVTAITDPYWTGGALEFAVTQGSGVMAHQSLVAVAPDGHVLSALDLPAVHGDVLAAVRIGRTVLATSWSGPGEPCYLDSMTWSGSLRWSREVSQTSCPGLTVASGGVVLLTEQDAVRAVVGLNGKSLWKAARPLRAGWGVLGTVADVVLLSAPAPVGYGTDIEARSLVTGRLLWRQRDDQGVPVTTGVVAGPDGWLDCPRSGGGCTMRSIRTDKVIRTFTRASSNGKAFLSPVALSKRYAVFGVQVLDTATPRDYYWVTSLAGTPYSATIPGPVKGGFTYDLQNGARTVFVAGFALDW